MKHFMFINYTFTGLEYPGIEYVESWTKNEDEFQQFLLLSELHPVTYTSATNGPLLHRQLTSSHEFYNGLYIDLVDGRNYMICSITL